MFYYIFYFDVVIKARTKRKLEDINTRHHMLKSRQSIQLKNLN